MFNWRASLAKTVLAMCLPILLLAVPVLLPNFDIRDYFREQPVRDIVGKWRVISSAQSKGETRLYEFRANGMYIKKVRMETLMGPEPGTNVPTGWGLVNITYHGRYKLSRNNKLTLVTQLDNYSLHVRVQGKGLVANGVEHWYRVN